MSAPIVDGAAVALFAKAPVPGRVKTRLVPPLEPEEAAWIARVCLEETLRRFPPRAPAAWTLFLDGAADESVRALLGRAGAALRPQGRGTLGTRLARAFRTLATEGATRVVAIGADSPTLDPARIRDALDFLREVDVVLGPAEDGGYYLIGSRIGPGPLFRRIPWSTDEVARVTERRAREHGLTVEVLPPWYDLDEARDLRRAALDAEASPALVAALAGVEAKLSAEQAAEEATSPS